MGESTFMIIRSFFKNILSRSNTYVFIIVFDSIMVAKDFYFIYYTFVLIFSLKVAISFINSIAFRGLVTLFIHKFFSAVLIN